jgi:5-methylcytosine-specific restriction enzyme A
MQCPLCGRTGEDEKLFEWHHLEPIATRRKNDEKVKVCHQCADQVHLLFDNTELRILYRSIESLKNAEKMQKYIKWVRNKPLESHYTTQEKKRK